MYTLLNWSNCVRNCKTIWRTGSLRVFFPVKAKSSIRLLYKWEDTAFCLYRTVLWGPWIAMESQQIRPDVVLMLARRRRRRASIKTTLGRICWDSHWQNPLAGRAGENSSSSHARKPRRQSRPPHRVPPGRPAALPSPANNLEGGALRNWLIIPGFRLAGGEGGGWPGRASLRSVTRPPPPRIVAETTVQRWADVPDVDPALNRS